jgi:predicted metalloendopeptidase
MTALNVDRERTIIVGAGASPSTSPGEQRVAAYYRACMDEPGIAARGLGPIRELLTQISAVRRSTDALATIADLHAHGVEAVFSTIAAADPGDSKQMIAWLDRGSLGMRDPAAYTRTEDTSSATCARAWRR